MSIALEKTLAELRKIFKLLNHDFFNGELSMPAIVIQQNLKKKHQALAWVTTKEVWLSRVDTSKHRELTFASEFLFRPIEDIIATMLHEMVHLDNMREGIKDFSRSGTYHNVKFKTKAELKGLLVDKSDKYGWSHTKLSEDTLKKIKQYDINESVFQAHREIAQALKDEGDSSKGKGSVRRYKCPCGVIIRATKEVNVLCGECGGKFVCDVGDEGKDEKDGE